MQNDSEVDNDVHPIAFEFPTRDPSRLYFPTVHVHDGAYNDTAGFYHRLYCQREDSRQMAGVFFFFGSERRIGCGEMTCAVQPNVVDVKSHQLLCRFRESSGSTHREF